MLRVVDIGKLKDQFMSQFFRGNKMSTSEAATTSNPAQEEYTLFTPREGRKEKEGTMFMVIIFQIYILVPVCIRIYSSG
jgi:hypothetical protein